jgi:hypothetical protein
MSTVRRLCWLFALPLPLLTSIQLTATAIDLKGLHAYADAESVAAGEVIRFHVSSEIPYRLRITRLGQKVDDRASDETIHLSDKPFAAKAQPIHPGSYIQIAKGLPAKEELNQLTVECWVRPWKLSGWQGIITQHDYPEDCGFGLFLNGTQATFSIGTGGEYDRKAVVSGGKLKVRKWHHLVATWNGQKAALWIDGKQSGSWSAPENFPARKAGRAALRIGAYGQSHKASSFLDGDIAHPTLYSRELSPTEIAARFASQGLKAPSSDGLLAHWPLNEERGKEVADASGNGHSGEIINLGTWMIGGPSFDGSKISRYADYDPRKDASRGHALRLASDDLYDCGWTVSNEYRVPENARSGIYAAWFEFDLNGQAHRYPVTFIVRKAASARKSPLAVLCATTTWRAYGGAPFARNVPREDRFWSTGGQTNDPSNPTAYCMYRDHRSGQPAYQVGLKMPWPVAGPDIRYSSEKVDYSHLMRGERFTHVWLEKQGYDFDVYTSLDLHRDPDLLKGYRALIINGHDEYWSKEMYEGVDQYLSNGGSAAVLSGNTMFWRVTFDEELGVMECRKYGPGIGGRKFANVGEAYHSHDGERGSLMRNCGYPSWKVIGLDCSGWWGGANNGVYTPTQTDHFLYQRPERVTFNDRATFGHAPTGYRRAGGHEGDIRLSSFAKPVKPPPDGGVIPAEPKGIQTVASIKRKNARALDYFANFGKVDDATLVDMIWWERPQGGKVFHAGAIAWGWTLDVDPKQTKVMRNVLFHLAGLKARTPYDPKFKEPDSEASRASTMADGPIPKFNFVPNSAVIFATSDVVQLQAEHARTNGGSVRINSKVKALAWWKTSKDQALWKIEKLKPGRYSVKLEYAAPDSCAGQEFSLSANGQIALKKKVISSGGWGKFKTSLIGEISIEKAATDIAISPASSVKAEDLFDLKKVILRRIK